MSEWEGLEGKHNPESKLPLHQVVSWFSRSLGEEKAETLVQEHAERLALNPAGPFDLEQVRTLLDLIAEDPGLIGMTAMLVKSRLHFMAASTTLEA